MNPATQASEPLPRSADTCGCDDFESSRRRFLAGSAALGVGAGLTGMFGEVFTQASFGAAAPGDDSVLVVLSMRGGADGMSMLVPHGDPAYALARPTIGIPRDRLVGGDGMFGFHPGLAPLMPMWRDGRLAALPAVGLPTANRSHFSAMEAIEDAAAGSGERVGWLNRMVGQIAGTRPEQAMHLGSSRMPESLHGPHGALAVKRIQDLKVANGQTPESQAMGRRAMRRLWTDARSPMRAAAVGAIDSAERLTRLSNANPRPANGAAYPAGDLGDALIQMAHLIRTLPAVRVLTVDSGGWDMHVNLGMVGEGRMHDSVTELGRALAAFFTDLGGHSRRVTVVTISEFGRKLTENSARGADHGYANAMFVMGAGVRGGRVHGRWPGLDVGLTTADDLTITTDYRDVLGSVVASRFPGVDLSAVFPGHSRGPLDLMV